MTKPKARRQNRPPGWKGLPHSTKLWIILAVGASGLAGVLTQWPQWFPGPPPERQVAIYRTHGCKCVFTWARQLEDSGYAVTMYEPESLKAIRGALKAPASSRGCHIGRYLEYFVEGHVPPAALAELARSHPSGPGVAADVGNDARGHSPGAAQKRSHESSIFIYDEEGLAHSWVGRGGPSTPVVSPYATKADGAEEP